MKERNKSIFRILLFASAGILLAQTVLMVVLGDDAEVRIMLPVIIFFSELITGGMIAYFTLNPQYNRNYTIHRRDGRWRWGADDSPALCGYLIRCAVSPRSK